MELIKEIPFAFFAAAGFGVLFQAPKKSLIAGGLTGMIGWIVFRILGIFGLPHVLTIFAAAVVVAVLGELMARLYRTPVTVFTVAGIVPLVPGSLAYSTMYHLAKGDYLEGLALGTKTFLAAGAIAAGLVFIGALARAVKYRGERSVAEFTVNHQK